MVGKARTLVGSDEDIIRLSGLLDHKIDPDNGDADCLRCLVNRSSHAVGRTDAIC